MDDDLYSALSSLGINFSEDQKGDPFSSSDPTNFNNFLNNLSLTPDIPESCGNRLYEPIININLISHFVVDNENSSHPYQMKMILDFVPRSTPISRQSRLPDWSQQMTVSREMYHSIIDNLWSQAVSFSNEST